jgi:hypothetical protein
MDESKILRRIGIKPGFGAVVYKRDEFGDYEVRSKQGELLQIFKTNPTDREVKIAWENSGKPHWLVKGETMETRTLEQRLKFDAGLTVGTHLVQFVLGEATVNALVYISPRGVVKFLEEKRGEPLYSCWQRVKGDNCRNDAVHVWAIEGENVREIEEMFQGQVKARIEFARGDSGKFEARIAWKDETMKQIHIEGRRWFQRTYGNTYHTARVWVENKLAYTSPPQ